jgi:galactan endo-1,6-beta-galactosidase
MSRSRTAATFLVATCLLAACTPYQDSDQDESAVSGSNPVDPSKSYGTWQGWGTSLAWWGKEFGTRDDLADLMFTLKDVTYQGATVPGLGLNIVRYNAGASSSTPINGQSMVVSPNIKPATQVEGYWLNWSSSDPASSSWNWWVDSNQRNMMWKARDRGANHFELFSNSPMWWMLYNHNPSGAADAGENLQSWNYQQHAVYLATIAKYAHDKWGVNFETVEAFNEPSASWWKATGTQEGCHIGASVQSEVIHFLRAELDKRSLTSVGVSASDESYYDQARATWGAFSSATKAVVSRVNVHGYQYGGGRRDLLYSAVSASGKKIWNSEYGDGDGSGLQLASNLNLDRVWLHPTAWVYWQGFDGGGWGLIQGDRNTGALGPVNPKYYVLAHYTRHIREGFKVIESGNGNTFAAYDAAAHRLILVTINYATAQTISYDLSRFNTVQGDHGLIRRWSTQIKGSERYGYHEDTKLSGKTFASSFPANTIQTFEIDGVDP